MASGNSLGIDLGTAGQVLTSNGAVLPPSFQNSASGGVTSVSGTTNRITSTGVLTPVIDISASYVGQTSITTLGTISSGTWNGTKVSPSYGGTARPMTWVSTTTLSGQTTLDFTNLTESLYFWVIRNCVCGDTFSADRSILIRVSDDNGSTFKSGASDYSYAWTGRVISATAGGNSTGSTQIETGMNSADTDDNPNAAGYYEIKMQNANTASRKALLFGSGSSGEGDTAIFSGIYKTAAAINAVRFYLSAGTFISGTVYQYYITEGA